MNQEMLDKAALLIAEARRLKAEAFAMRPLPDKWRVGMRVRYLHSAEWAWGQGTEATIVELSDECADQSGSEYQVFWASPDSGDAIWWTTPNDVELVHPKG